MQIYYILARICAIEITFVHYPNQIMIMQKCMANAWWLFGDVHVFHIIFSLCICANIYSVDTVDCIKVEILYKHTRIMRRFTCGRNVITQCGLPSIAFAIYTNQYFYYNNTQNCMIEFICIRMDAATDAYIFYSHQHPCVYNSKILLYTWIYKNIWNHQKKNHKYPATLYRINITLNWQLVYNCNHCAFYRKILFSNLVIICMCVLFNRFSMFAPIIIIIITFVCTAQI